MPRKKGASVCVITGGEPLQHNLDNFCKAIKKMTMGEEQKPMKIHIETSGVNSISEAMTGLLYLLKDTHLQKIIF